MALDRHKWINKTPPNHLQDPSHQKSSKYMFRASFVHHWTNSLRGVRVEQSYKGNDFCTDSFPRTPLTNNYTVNASASSRLSPVRLGFQAATISRPSPSGNHRRPKTNGISLTGDFINLGVQSQDSIRNISQDRRLPYFMIVLFTLLYTLR